MDQAPRGQAGAVSLTLVSLSYMCQEECSQIIECMAACFVVFKECAHD